MEQWSRQFVIKSLPRNPEIWVNVAENSALRRKWLKAHSENRLSLAEGSSQMNDDNDTDEVQASHSVPDAARGASYRVLDLHETTAETGSASHGTYHTASPQGVSACPPHPHSQLWGADIVLTQLRQVTKLAPVTLPSAVQGPCSLFPRRI